MARALRALGVVMRDVLGKARSRFLDRRMVFQITAPDAIPRIISAIMVSRRVKVFVLASNPTILILIFWHR